MKVLIYSNKHHSWWRKDYAGYGRIEDAGIYELDDVLSDRCYADFDFDNSKDNYLVKLEDTKDDFAKRKAELFSEIDSLNKTIDSCCLKQKELWGKIAAMDSASNQIDPGETPRVDRSVKPAIRVLPFKNGDYRIYVGNSITTRRVFHDYNAAMAYAKELQGKKRVLIEIHREDGLVANVIVPPEARCLKPKPGEETK